MSFNQQPFEFDPNFMEPSIAVPTTTLSVDGGTGQWIMLAKGKSGGEAVTSAVGHAASLVLLDYISHLATSGQFVDSEWGNQLCEPFKKHLADTLAGEFQRWIHSNPNTSDTETCSILSELWTEVEDGIVAVSLGWTVGKHDTSQSTKESASDPQTEHVTNLKYLKPITCLLSRQPNPQHLWKCETRANSVQSY